MASVFARIRPGPPRDLDQVLPEDAPTPILCFVCDGAFESLEFGATEYCVVRCRWCVRGAMSQSMLARWRSHRSGVIPKPTS